MGADHNDFSQIRDVKAFCNYFLMLVQKEVDSNYFCDKNKKEIDAAILGFSYLSGLEKNIKYQHDLYYRSPTKIQIERCKEVDAYLREALAYRAKLLTHLLNKSGLKPETTEYQLANNMVAWLNVLHDKYNETVLPKKKLSTSYTNLPSA